MIASWTCSTISSDRDPCARRSSRYGTDRVSRVLPRLVKAAALVPTAPELGPSGTPGKMGTPRSSRLRKNPSYSLSTKALEAPMRLPRLTTRRLMVLVVAVAVVLSCSNSNEGDGGHPISTEQRIMVNGSGYLTRRRSSTRGGRLTRNRRTDVGSVVKCFKSKSQRTMPGPR